jgi:hypothetical protein
MAKCPFCNHSNRTVATQCEECGAPLRTTVSREPDSTPPVPTTAPEPGTIEAEILGLVQSNKKIQAIKLYRERSGVGLKEAKDFVEALAAKHGVASKSGGGCAGAVLLMCLVGGGIAGTAWLLALS